MGLILLIVLVLFLLGAWPTWPHSRNWGYYPSGGLGVLLARSEEHTSELQSLTNLVCPLLLGKKSGQALLAICRIVRQIPGWGPEPTGRGGEMSGQGGLARWPAPFYFFFTLAAPPEASSFFHETRFSP